MTPSSAASWAMAGSMSTPISSVGMSPVTSRTIAAGAGDERRYLLLHVDGLGERQRVPDSQRDDRVEAPEEFERFGVGSVEAETVPVSAG